MSKDQSDNKSRKSEDKVKIYDRLRVDLGEHRALVEALNYHLDANEFIR